MTKHTPAHNNHRTAPDDTEADDTAQNGCVGLVWATLLLVAALVLTTVVLLLSLTALGN